MTDAPARIGTFERYLTLWVALCIACGIALGRAMPSVFQALGSASIADVNLPVALLVWLMIVPMLLKIDPAALREVGQHWRGIATTVGINWLVKPFSMALLGYLFIGDLFRPLLPAAQVPSYLAGLILLYVEFTNPGMVAPGVIGGICVLLSILGFSLLPINYVGVLLILLALGLFVAEVKVQGFGVLGFGGIAAMVVGMLILVESPDPAMRIGLATALAVAVPFAVIFIILLVALLKSLKQQAATGTEGMVGLVGTADSEIHRQGRVRVRGEYWAARSEHPIAPGKTVRVVGVDGLTLRVEEVGE